MNLNTDADVLKTLDSAKVSLKLDCETLGRWKSTSQQQ